MIQLGRLAKIQPRQGLGLLLIITVLLLILINPALAWADQIGTVTADVVNIRSGAGTSYSVVGSARRGDTFVILNQQGEWFQIRYNNASAAWINSQFLDISSNDNLPTRVSALRGTVNVRSGPGTDYAVLGNLSGSATLTVIGESGHWYAVSFNGGRGYVAKWLVAADYDPAGPAQPPTAPVNTSGLAQALVNTSTLNLRATPGGEIIDRLSNNTRLHILSSQEGWYEVVTAAGLRGWVSADFIVFDQAQVQAATMPVASAPVFIGTEPQGRIEVSWERHQFGYRLILEGDTLIKHQVISEPRSLRIVTDMQMVGLPPGSSDLQMSFGGLFSNELTISGNQAIHYGINVENHGRRLVLTVGLSPLVGRTIFIDPGHGGFNENGILDRGVSRESMGLFESEIVLEIALHMEEILTDMGATVLLLRRGPTTDLRFERRAYPANAANADVLVSIHVDGSNNLNANGSSTFFFAPAGDNRFDRAASQLLAQLMQEQLLAYGGLADRGVREANFAVLRASQMPAVLVETAFMSNDVDIVALADPAWRRRVAEGLSRGLLNYFAQIR